MKSKLMAVMTASALMTAAIASETSVIVHSSNVPDDSIHSTIAQPIRFDDTLTVDTAGTDTAVRYLPGAIRDTTGLYLDTLRRVDYRSQIHALARAYGDSIVLRWSAEDYVSWQYLNSVGVDVLRMHAEHDDYVIDTLAHALKPATLEEFKALYSESDSVAAMAMGLLYGEGKMRQDQSKYEPGSLGALLDVYGDQQMTFGFAVLVSEWRPDLANHLAMRFVDRTVKAGINYEYSILPAKEDASGELDFRAGYIEEIKKGKYVPYEYDAEIGDSLVAPNTIRLWWNDQAAGKINGNETPRYGSGSYSSYEIERREVGSTDWQRVNINPYIMFMEGNEGEDCFISDEVPHPGDYEYRVFAHDPFGDLTNPSHIYTTHIKDIEAPRPPMLEGIEIDRRDTTDLSRDVYATIYFSKDTIEADLAGFVPMYRNDNVNNGEWKPLCDKQLAITDTMVVVDVTGLPTGELSIAAYDNSGNVGFSMPAMIRITDMKPPHAPLGLKAKASIEGIETGNPVGLIRLEWNAISDDDIDYYEIAFANDTTHLWMDLKHGSVSDTVFVDSVALDVNQKYIYYKVRAIDYSTNIGEYSDILEVIRPSLIPPTAAHLDSAWVDSLGISIRWIASDEQQVAYHKVYRRLEGTTDWNLIRVCDGDSVREANNMIFICDKPRYNSDSRYEYAVESYNYSDIQSELSLALSINFAGDAVNYIPIHLVGDYDERKKETRIAWDVDEAAIEPLAGEGFNWYFCVYRQGPDDDMPQFLISVDPKERSSEDYLLRAGQEALYYVVVQLDAGRESTPSNVVKVKAPEKK